MWASVSATSLRIVAMLSPFRVIVPETVTFPYNGFQGIFNKMHHKNVRYMKNRDNYSS